MVRKRWNHESILFFVVLVIALLGLFSAIKLPLSARFTIGPGMAPLIYATCVILFAAVLILQALRSKSSEKLIPPSGSKGLIFFVLCILFASLAYIVGFVISMFIFSALALVYSEGWKFKKALPFGLIWTLAIYWFFEKLLTVPLLPGMLFGS